MPRTRFRTKLASPRHVMSGATADNRRSTAPGDAPGNPTERPRRRWSLATYPYPPDDDPTDDMTTPREG